MINHFIMPHRDDLMLSLGGFLLKNLNEKNIEYLVYGTDSYLTDDFKKGLFKGRKNLDYLHKLAKQSELLGLFSELKSLIKKSKTSPLIGIYTRIIEEKALANLLNIQLHDFFLPCGYPLRGYDTFNSSESKDFKNDYEIQKDILINGSRSQYFSQIELLANKSLYPSSLRVTKESLIDILKKNIQESEKETHNIYLLVGIGGHPDHLILVKLIDDLVEILKSYKVNIFVAQDLPYASVNEWFQYSPLELDRLKKTYIDITDVLEDKIKLLNRYYNSQLNKENLRVVKEYHLSIARLLDKTYVKENLTDLNLKKSIAFEIVYKIT